MELIHKTNYRGDAIMQAQRLAKRRSKAVVVQPLQKEDDKLEKVLRQRGLLRRGA